MAITCEEPEEMLAQPDVEQHWGKVQISQNMKRYFLVPPDDRNWLAPSEIAEQFRHEFALVNVNVESARKTGDELLAKYRLLIEAGLENSQSTSLEELENRWKDALSIAVVIDEDAEEWFRTIACWNYRLELHFGPSVAAHKHRSLAQRAAKALGYLVQSADGD